jgi:hypothetical protein
LKKEIAGFSLIQILISALLFSSLAVVTFKIRKQQVVLGKSSSYAFESLVILDKMKTLLSDPGTCSATLAGRNPVYAEIDSIIRKDTIETESIKYFEVYDVNKSIYGNKDVLIKTMSIESSKGTFSLKNGYTLFKVRFEDITSNGKRFKNFTFPIHLTLNDKGNISSCFSLEGLGAININNAVGKWQKVNNQNIKIKTRSVNVGQIETKGELNIKGSMRLDSKYTKCNKNRYGSIRYGKEQGLLFCGQRELWEKVHYDKSFKLVKKSFTVKSKNFNKEKVMITEKQYSFCQVDKSYFSGGRCYASSVSQDEYKSRWKLVADLNNGDSISCNFSCYK